MVQPVVGAAGVSPEMPTEQSPLLNGPGGELANGNGTASKYIANVVEDEESQGEGEIETENGIGTGQVARIIAVLLIGSFPSLSHDPHERHELLKCMVGAGIFVAHTDGSILLATHPIIASEFNRLEDSTWLITSFALAGAATQTLVRSRLARVMPCVLVTDVSLPPKVRKAQRHLRAQDAGHCCVPHICHRLVSTY